MSRIVFSDVSVSVLYIPEILARGLKQQKLLDMVCPSKLNYYLEEFLDHVATIMTVDASC